MTVLYRTQQTGAWVNAGEIDECSPYKSLRTFEPEDADCCFGCDQLEFHRIRKLGSQTSRKVIELDQPPFRPPF